jgi:hypothetical protein
MRVYKEAYLRLNDEGRPFDLIDSHILVFTFE